MSEVILVVLQRPETAAMVLRAAGRLAMLAGGARVSALAMQTPLGLTSLMGNGSIPEEMLAGMQTDERKRLALLKEIFDGWAAEPGVVPASALWSTVEGYPDRPVAERGRRADFLVLARPTVGDDWTVDQAFQAALLKTERPVLVVPPGMATMEIRSPDCHRLAGRRPGGQGGATSVALPGAGGSGLPARRGARGQTVARGAGNLRGARHCSRDARPGGGTGGVRGDATLRGA